MSEIRKAKLAFLSQPQQDVYLLNLQFEGGINLRVELSKAQLANIVVDGAGMSLRSVRLGVESLVPHPSYTEPA